MRPTPLRIAFFVSSVLAVMSARADLPEPGRYVGTLSENGRISFAFTRDSSRITRIRCFFIARDSASEVSELYPKYYEVSFSSGSEQFKVYESNNFRFGVERFDMESQTFFWIFGRKMGKRLFRGHVQYQQNFEVEYLNPQSGQVETFKGYRGLTGPNYFTARLQGRSRRP